MPYWRKHIVPQIQAGKSVLVIGHKNSFRALWQYIERTPDEEALDAKLAPASAPLIYEFNDLGDSGLVFTRKYIMNFPTMNPKLGPGTKVLGKAYFLQNAESVFGWSEPNGFAGWEDDALSFKGEQQATEAGLCLKEKGIKVDMVFTSVLQRAVRTAELACMTSNNAFAVPVVKSWYLNGVHSGGLHGMPSGEANAKFGEAAKMFRKTLCVPPGCLERTDPRHPANNPLYADVPPEDLPGGESYGQMVKRVLPFWKEKILPHIKAGKTVLIVSHQNPLKALFEHLSDANDAIISRLPYVVEFGIEFGTSDTSGNPLVLTKYPLASFAPQFSSMKPLGKAVFLRHGQSLANLNESFTGWENSGLTPKGEKEAVEAGRHLREENYKFDVVITSVLCRAVESVERILKTSENSGVPIIKSWRMNARHPGVIQGLTKPEAVKLYGKDKVNLWRGSYDVMPECVPLDDPRHPINDPLYAGVPQDQLPAGGETLKGCMGRVIPFWQQIVQPRIAAGETVLIVGHKNSLKALMMYLEDTSEHDMFDVRPVSSTAPLVFEFGDSGFSSGLTILKKYWVKHTDKEALKKSKDFRDADARNLETA